MGLVLEPKDYVDSPPLDLLNAEKIRMFMDPVAVLNRSGNLSFICRSHKQYAMLPTSWA